jgi:hypothetical protein
MCGLGTSVPFLLQLPIGGGGGHLCLPPATGSLRNRGPNLMKWGKTLSTSALPLLPTIDARDQSRQVPGCTYQWGTGSWPPATSIFVGIEADDEGTGDRCLCQSNG